MMYQLAYANGHNCIIVFFDYFTKWAKVLWTLANENTILAIFIFNHIISRFGVTQDIVIGHGSHFQNKMMTKLVVELGFW